MTGTEKRSPGSARLGTEDAMAMVAGAHTGIVATLRSNGTPVMTPVWFVVDDGDVCFRTRMASKKIARLLANDHCSFLVETGTAWRSLQAAHVQGRATILSPADARFDVVQAAIDAKYEPYRTAPSVMPASTRAVYGKPPAIVVVTAERVIGWDNRKLVAAGDDEQER